MENMSIDHFYSEIKNAHLFACIHIRPHRKIFDHVIFTNLNCSRCMRLVSNFNLFSFFSTQVSKSTHRIVFWKWNVQKNLSSIVLVGTNCFPISNRWKDVIIQTTDDIRKVLVYLSPHLKKIARPDDIQMIENFRRSLMHKTNSKLVVDCFVSQFAFKYTCKITLLMSFHSDIDWCCVIISM